jgi:hypothetical protein
MYHEETPTWIPFFRAFGEIVMVKTPSKCHAKLQNRGIPGIYAGPAKDHKCDTYYFWIPITKHVVEPCSAVFLQQTNADFYKLDISQISKNFAIITNELNEMFD